MKYLAIETSSAACSVALVNDDNIYVEHHTAPMQQTQLVLPMIDRLLKTHNISLNQLDAIAFGCGPGSFTGVRIATSVAQGLGFGLDIPLIPISSLAALAQTAFHEQGWKKIVVAIDARMSEVYWATYEINPQGLAMLCGIEQLGSPKDITALNHTWYGAGNAWEVYSHEIKYQPIAIDTQLMPTALGVAQLAKEGVLNGSGVEAHLALPVYLRDNVAQKSRI